jgi:hypothetical protein
LMVAMDGKMKIAFNGVGNGQQQGGGHMMVQCRRWVATVQWTTATAVVMDNGTGGSGQRWTMERALDDGSGQWTFEAVTARQQCLTAVAVVAAAATVT